MNYLNVVIDQQTKNKNSEKLRTSEICKNNSIFRSNAFKL